MVGGAEDFPSRWLLTEISLVLARACFHQQLRLLDPSPETLRPDSVLLRYHSNFPSVLVSIVELLSYHSEYVARVQFLFLFCFWNSWMYQWDFSCKENGQHQTVHPRAESHTGLVWFQSVASVWLWTVRRQEETGSKGHSTKTWPMMKWLFWTHRESSGPWAKRAITCGVRREKKCACLSCHCLDAKLPERKNLRNA